MTVVRPTELISAGLTHAPNITGGEALDNARGGEYSGTDMCQALSRNDAAVGAAENGEEMNKSCLIELLAQFGVTLAAEAGEAEILAGIRSLGEHATALPNESGHDIHEREQLQVALMNERQARVEMILELAQRDGRITPAQRNEWNVALTNAEDFTAKLAELSALPAVIKTSSRTLELAGRTVAIANQDELTTRAIELVQERMRTKNENYDTAFNTVRREYPALFEAMKRPETKP